MKVDSFTTISILPKPYMNSDDGAGNRTRGWSVWALKFFLIVILSNSGRSFPASVMDALTKLKGSLNDMYCEALVETIRAFQRFMGIEEDGHCGPGTRKALKESCGVNPEDINILVSALESRAVITRMIEATILADLRRSEEFSGSFDNDDVPQYPSNDHIGLITIYIHPDIDQQLYYPKVSLGTSN